MVDLKINVDTAIHDGMGMIGTEAVIRDSQSARSSVDQNLQNLAFLLHDLSSAASSGLS
ncbi:hypothetical protein PanWU01x14_108880 [Parasponia andersonii]|uniref:Uncharacterized protein n=1 Tax=Parasponia andersonii TaxID=3476 RepID=A0A2P5CZJ8_PARAD|nr:hypothetical protein PanWU01x14_108880 [Parasponia andersonii]